MIIKFFEWLIKKSKKALISLYNKTWLLATFWTTFIIILTILWDYYNCVSCANAVGWLSNIATTALILFIANVIVLMVFTFIQLMTIRKNKQEGKKEFDNIDILEGADSSEDYIVVKSYINVLPWYIIGIYSISRIVIFVVMFFRGEKSISIGLDFFGIWLLIFIMSWLLWFKLKKYANEDNTTSVGYTISVIVITWLSLYWEMLIPYFIDLSEVSRCIVETYVIENHLSVDNNITECKHIK